MARSVARSLAGQKAYSHRDHYRGKKLTLIGGIKKGKVLAKKVIEGSMKGEDFYDFIKEELIGNLQAGDVVILDNLNTHHREDIQELIQSVGARIEYLPIYSPEFNPIEMMWSQLKSMVRKFKTKTVDALEKVITVAISLVDPKQLKNWFTKCCYCSD